MDTTHLDTKDLCVRSVRIMADGTLEDFESVVHPDARNREDVDEPPASRGRGPSAFYATALWLRGAYADLRWDIHDVVAEGDLVVLYATMPGRHVGTFVSYDADACPAQAFPPTGKRFATTQTHWFRVAEKKVIEHWANRDDLGTSMQLGWTRRRRCTWCGCYWRPDVLVVRPEDSLCLKRSSRFGDIVRRRPGTGQIHDHR